MIDIILGHVSDPLGLTDCHIDVLVLAGACVGVCFRTFQEGVSFSDRGGPHPFDRYSHIH